MAEWNNFVPNKVLAIMIISIVVAAGLAGTYWSRTPNNPYAQATADPGALIRLKMKSQVGVLLDEIPKSERDRATSDLISKPEHFWKQRAEDQIRLMDYRLIFRGGFYDENESKDALPLPPEDIWSVQLIGAPKRTTTMDNHDIILMNYSFTSTLLTDRNSPGKSEPALNSIGGKWAEPFILPMDPELVFQRTEFACMNENQFPPHSVDSEEVDTYYDQEADIKGDLSIEDTHQAVMPHMSCVDALAAKIGKIETRLVFERLPWSPVLADNVRIGKITNPTGADLIVEEADFKVNRVVYRYIGSNSCAIAEGSIGGKAGWHRLLQFGAADRNFGAKALEIGNIDYFVKGNETDLSKRGIYEYSPCHHHYHFAHYGSFSFGSDTNNQIINHKMGFCLQSTNRFSNNEYSPLTNRYSGCSFQGIEAGWSDEYKAGLEGQWVDITSINTSKNPVNAQLTFHSNPDGFLCEGTSVLDANGNHVYEPTQFKTHHNQTVYRQKCDFGNGTLENNVDSYNVTIPIDGNGYVTDDCKHGEIGPLRNCGFHMAKNPVFNCTPGQKVNLNVTIPQAAPAQVIRVCDYSSVLATSVPCTYNGPYNAKSLTNNVVESTSTVTFTCPNALDEKEEGGKFSLYIAPVLPEDSFANIIYKIN